MKKKDTLEEAIAYIESGKQCYYHYRLESKLKPISQDEARELLKDRHWSFGNSKETLVYGGTTKS